MSERPAPDRRQLGGTDMKRLHRTWRRQTTAPLSLLLDGVQNPFNVGSIVRTAAALGVDHVWLAGDTADPSAAKTQKTALGTQRYLTWTTVDDPLDAVREVQSGGGRVVGLELATGSEPLHQLDLRGHVCLAIGHEDRGLGKALLAACDAVGYIPLTGRVGSLNVAAATGIALYEVRRQEWAPGPTLGSPPGSPP